MTKPPIKFVREDGGIATLYCCGTCGAQCGVGVEGEAYARYHCGGRPCEKCGQPCERNLVLCSACITAAAAQKCANAERINAEDFDGPVFWEEGEEFFVDVGAAFEMLWDCDDAMSMEWRAAQTIRPCTVQHLVLDVEQLVFDTLEHEGHHEDACEELPAKAWDSLREFQEMWNKEYGTEVASWFPDTSKRVIIPQQWWDECDAEHKRIMDE